jgi:gliding motility-associated-like protein
MKKFTKAILVCLTLLSLMPTKVKATHCAGAELEYEWISDSTYRFYYKFYRDCVGIPAPTSVQLCYHNSCTGTQYTANMNAIVGLLPAPNARGLSNGDDVSNICSGNPMGSTCTNPMSTIPGYQVYEFTCVVTLPMQCNFWTFEVVNSARNNAISNLCNPGGNALYCSTTFDNLNAQGDSSPELSTLPVPYYCLDQPVTFNNGAYDINNDSLSFNIIQPLTGSCGTLPSPITFGHPADSTLYFTTHITSDIIAACPPSDTNTYYNTVNNPLATSNTFHLNNSNGIMTFIPTEEQRSVVAMRVTEWRKINGVIRKIGTVERDMQIIILPCSTAQPSFGLQTPTLTGGTYDSAANIIYACALNTLHFSFEATSPNPASLLHVVDNHNQVIPTANVTYTGPPDSVKGTFSWTPTIVDTGEKIFTVLIEDSTCNSTSAGIKTVQVYTLPIFIFAQTAILNDTSICLGGSAKLLAIGGSDFVWGVLPGGSPLTSLSCTTCNNPTATPTVTTQYTVTANSDLYCKNKDTVTVTVITPIVVTSTDTTTCVKNALQLNVNIVAPPPGNHYTVRWSPGAFLSDSTVANPILSNDTLNTRYIITVTSTDFGHCAVRDTLNVRVLKGFKINNSDTAICKGASVQINATGSAYHYQWTPMLHVSDPHFLAPIITPDTSGRYVLTASYPGCRDSVQSLYIQVQPVPVVIAGANKTICSGDTAHLDGRVFPAYAYKYQWTPDSSLNVDSSAHVIFSGLYTTTFHFKATTSAGCTGTDSLTITVLKHKYLIVSNDTAVCPHDSLQISVRGNLLKSFYWHPNYAISDTTNPNPTIYPPGNIRYTVYGVDSNRCRDTASVYVTLRPAAVVNLPDSVTLYPGDSIQMSPLTNCAYFSWFPVDGLNNPLISDPVARPGTSTRYIATGTTEFGCVGQDSIDVYVSPDSYIAMPNAFAPGTGVNAQLKVLHLGQATLTSFHIFNRWGVEVFQSADINKGWDGMYGGQPQPMGVYIYTVEAKTFKGKVISRQGNITLLR